MEAIPYITQLISKGKNVGIISCEDPYNSLFHHDVLTINPQYVHLMTEIGSRIKPASIELALQFKHINSFGIFGHYGLIHGNEVCAAIKALEGNYSHYGPELEKVIQRIAEKFTYRINKDLRGNVLAWTEQQFRELIELVGEKQRTLKGAVHGQIEVFAGIVENLEHATKYKAEVIWREIIDQKIVIKNFADVKHQKKIHLQSK